MKGGRENNVSVIRERTKERKKKKKKKQKKKKKRTLGVSSCAPVREPSTWVRRRCSCTGEFPRCLSVVSVFPSTETSAPENILKKEPKVDDIKVSKVSQKSVKNI